MLSVQQGSKVLDKILNWLVTTDPSPNHNNACELHEPQTGTWLTSSKEYKEWKNCATRFLWLHGIPGAGKTVLFSYICGDIRQQCKAYAPKAAGYAYYYCYFRRAQDETPHLLRWFISQLCRQFKRIPDEVLRLYDEGVQPSVKQLKGVLTTVSALFPKVYLLIDALDESTERHKLLRFLEELIQDPSLQHIQVLAMSREELDIRLSLEDISVGISMSNAWIDKDIQLFLCGQMRNAAFQAWSRELCLKVETALVKGAKGMFRWAYCQLEILKKLKFRKDILEALTRLPKTLDETYERILCVITLENRPYVRKVLHLLSYDFGMEYLLQIHAALAIDNESLEYQKDDPPCDPLAIVDICTCLLTCSEDPLYGTKVKLAHYTVKEYLVSDRVSRGPAAYFELSEVEANTMMMKAILVYMLNTEIKRDLALNDLGFAAIRIWRGLLERAITTDREDPKEPIARLVLKLLDPYRPGFEVWFDTFQSLFASTAIDSSTSYGVYGPTGRIRYWFPDWVPDWVPKPRMKICYKLAWLCWFDIFSPAEILMDEFLHAIPFDLPFATTKYSGTDGAIELANGTISYDVTLIEVAARLQRTLFMCHFENRADQCFGSKASMTALQSVLCLCPEDVHLSEKHLGTSLEPLVAVESEIWDSSGVVTSSQLLYLSLDDILREFGAEGTDTTLSPESSEGCLDLNILEDSEADDD